MVDFCTRYDSDADIRFRRRQVYGPIIPGLQMLARVLSGKREVVRLTD